MINIVYLLYHLVPGTAHSQAEDDLVTAQATELWEGEHSKVQEWKEQVCSHV